MPNRSSRQRSCFCRSARHAMSLRPAPGRKKPRATAQVRIQDIPAVRRVRTAHGLTPKAHLLSNGRYAVMLTAAGSGYSRWHDLGITRWREDATRDDWGSYIFLRDVRSGRVWSAGYQPSGVERTVPMSGSARIGPRSLGATDRSRRRSKSSFRRRTTRKFAVCPISNAGNQTRDIEITSYAELVLAPPAADAAHPAFSKLFVQTEYRRQGRRHPGDAAAAVADRAARSGRRILPSSKARRWARRRSKPIARASSAADATSARRWP